MKYAVEWDYDSLYRKYHSVVCYVFVVAEQREYIAFVYEMKRRDHPESGAEINPCVTYHIMDDKGNYGVGKTAYVDVTHASKLIPEAYPEIKLRPLAIKPRIVQSRVYPGNVMIFSRTRRKSFKCGIASENFHIQRIKSEKPEHLDTGNVLFPKDTFNNVDGLEVIDPVIYVLDGDLMVYDKHVGFVKDNVAKISSRVVRKLIAERAPQWRVQSL